MNRRLKKSVSRLGRNIWLYSSTACGRRRSSAMMMSALAKGYLRGDGGLYRAAGGILFTKKPRMYIRGFENLLPQTINQPGAGRGPPPRPGRTSGSAFVLPG